MTDVPPSWPTTNSGLYGWLQGLLTGATPSRMQVPPPAAPQVPRNPAVPGVAPIQLPSTPSVTQDPLTRATGGGSTSFQVPPLSPRPQVPQIPNPPPPSQIPMPDYSGTRLPIPNSLQQIGMPDYARARAALEAGRPKPPDTGQESSASAANILAGLAKGAASVSATEPGSFAKALAAAGAGASEARGKAIEGGLSRQEAYERERTRYQEGMAGQERGEEDAAQRARQFNVEQSTRLAEDQQRTMEFNALRAMHEADTKAEIGKAQAAVNDQYGQLTWKNQFANAEALYKDALERRQEEMPKIEKDANGFRVYNPVTGQIDYHETRSRMEKLDSIYNTLKALNPGDTGADLRVMEAVGQMNDLDPQTKVSFLKEWVVRQAAARNQLQAVFGHQWGDINKKIDAEFSKDQNMKIMATTHPTDYHKLVQERAVGELMTQLLQSKDDGWVYDLAAAGSPIARWMTSGGQR